MTQTKINRVFGIIPARYGSTRFPGKPLTPILGKPMFWHVYNRASHFSELDHGAVHGSDAHLISPFRLWKSAAANPGQPSDTVI